MTDKDSPNEPIIILGIDPGTRSTGYGILCYHPHRTDAIDYGCIRPPFKATSSQRYRIIFEGIEKLITIHKPKVLSVEGQFIHKNALSAMKLGMARAMAILAAERAEIPIYEYAPRKVKKSLVGYGGASKQQMQQLTRTLLGLDKIPPEDAADALALALCHTHSLSLPHV